MAKTDRIAVRLPADVKAALTQAAAEDRRSLSAMAEKIIAEWLAAAGKLKAAQQ